MMESSVMEGEELYNPEASEWRQKVDTGQLCRVCANANEYLIPIFDGEGLEHELGMKIQKHLPIKVTETDTLPQQMCYQCASTLIAWHDLVITCLEADKKLREIQVEEEGEDEDDDDKAVEMFESPLLDSEINDDAVQPSTSETQNQVSKTVSPKKSFVSKEKKPKLKMVLVKGPAGTSGQKTSSKTSVAKALELAKSKVGASQDSASERSHGFGKSDFKQAAPSTLQVFGNSDLSHSLQVENHVKSDNANEHLYSIWIKTDDEEYYLCDVKELENDVQVTEAAPVDARVSVLEEESASQHQLEWNANASLLNEHDYIQTKRNEYAVNRRELEHEPVLKFCKTFVTGVVRAPKKLALKCVVAGGRCCAKPVLINQPLQCKRCLKYFRSDAVSLTHLRMHTGFSPFYCKHCGTSFMLSSSLKQHMNHCTLTLNKNMVSEESHPLTKGSNEQYMCSICGKMYKLKPSLKDHLRAHFGRARRKQKCDVCGEKFLTKAEIKEHMVTHGTVFSCSTCDKMVINEKDLLDHMISHTDERPFSCSVCGSTYKRKSHLNRHVLTHAVNHKSLIQPHIRRRAAGKFKCHYCGKDWPTPSLLMAHQISHTGERNFECHICEKRFAQSGALTRHIRVVHNGAKDFTCEICQQSFTAKATKDNHMRIHTGEKPFQCDTCGKTFRTQQQHRIHERVHTDMRPYPCPYCEKRFRRRPHLIVHIRTHTGEKPYACQVCGRCFAQKNDMTKHMQIHNR